MINSTNDLRQIRRLLLARDDPGRLNEQLICLVHELSVGSRTFDAVYHPLGFVYVPLLRARDWTLRLHFWKAGGVPVVGTWRPYMVHMHTWDLYSYVLQGDLVNQVISVEETSRRADFRVFEIVGKDRVSTISPTSTTVRASISSEQRVSAGHFYSLPHGQYHTTLNPSGRDIVTAALVVRVPGTMERTLGPLDGQTHDIVRRPCASSELADHAAAAMATLRSERHIDRVVLGAGHGS